MKLSATLVLILFSFWANGQTPCEQYPEKYIPNDLNDAIAFLDCLWTEDDKQEITKLSEDEAIGQLHFGTGLAIRNGWKLWEANNAIYRFFKSKGITHPDDISSIILTSFYRHLSGKKINLEDQIAYYKAYWKKAKQESKKAKKALKLKHKKEFKEYQKGDTVRIAFNARKSKNQTSVSPLPPPPYLTNSSNCEVTGIVEGKRARKKSTYQLKIRVIDICGNQEVLWLDIHDRHGNFKVGETYDFFSIDSFRISR